MILSKAQQHLERWLSFVDEQLWECGNLDQSSYRVFLRAATLRVSPEQATRMVADRIRRAGGHLRPAKLTHQLRCAYAWISSTQKIPGNWLDQRINLAKPSPTWPAADPSAIDNIVSPGAGLYELWENSPIRWEDSESHVEEIIDILFPHNPLLCVGKSNYEFGTQHREVWRGALASLPLIVPNPMLAPRGQTQDGRTSEHTKAATSRRVYQVIEFDFAERDKNGKDTLWAPLIRKWKTNKIEIVDACAALICQLQKQLPLLVCVCFSGGKSLHAWFRVFGLSQAAQKDFMRRAVLLGADRATWNASQFVRIPDGLRKDAARQSCFYLDPRKAVRP